MIVDTATLTASLLPCEVLKALRSHATDVVAHHDPRYYPTECEFIFEEDGSLNAVRFTLVEEHVKESAVKAKKPNSLWDMFK